MKPEDKMRRLINNSDVAIGPQSDKRIIGDALAHLERIKQQTFSGQPYLWRIVMKNSITRLGFAAAVIFCLLGLLVLFGNGETLYAQVIEAIENTHTIHAITKSLNNGQWVKSTEVWYEDDKGIVETDWRGGERTSIRIDDGQYRWNYHAGNHYARRSSSVDPMGVAQKLLNAESFKERAIREPDEDKVVDGIRYTAYICSNPEHTLQILTWLDETKRVRGWEKMRLLDGGQWQTYRIGRVEYNMGLSEEVFTPDFGEDVEIVDIDTELDAYSDLDDALFTREELGLIFAVHQLRRCEGDLIFAVSSIRPSDTWRKKVRSMGPAVWDYGSYHFGSSWRRLDQFGRGSSYQPVDLGWIYHAGLHVRWTLFSAQGFEPEGPKECELEVYLSTTGGLREKRTIHLR